jgi:type IV secretory pathway VirB4 component
MFGWLRPARGEYLQDWVDWIESFNDEVIFTSTGGMLRLAEFEPPDLETAGAETRKAINDRFTDLLLMPGSGWSFWLDKIHLPDNSYPPRSDVTSPRAPVIVDDARRAQFATTEHQVFSDRHVLGMHWTPQQRDQVLAVLHDRDVRSAKERLQTFLDQTDQLLLGMSILCPSISVLADQHLGTALQFPISYRWIPTPLPRHFIAQQLGNLAEWQTGLELVIDGLHVAAVEVHAFGSITPDTVEALHELRYPYRWTTCLHCLDPDHQRGAIRMDRKRWEPKQFSLPGWIAVSVARDRSFGRARPDVMVALGELDELESGLHHERDGLAISSMTIRVWDEDRDVVQDRAQHIAATLNAGDLRCRVSTFPALSAVADIYGNASKDLINRRKAKVHISKMARCSPLTGLTTGYREDQHLGGPALLVARSRRHGPLFWSLHAPGSDVGHTAVIGPTGGGKSCLLSFMCNQYVLRYPTGTVTMFDKRHSAMVATLCAGGTWLEFGAGGIGVQPLRAVDDPDGFTWATGWLQEALKLRNVIINSRVDAALTEALTAVRDLPPDERTITSLCANLGGDEDARAALRHYTTSGPFGELFDGAVPGYGTSQWLTIEYDPIMQPNFPEGQLAFAACFHQIQRERLVDSGHPKLVIVDEAWEPLGHPLFRDWITNMALTGRKLNMALVLCTQSVRHLDADHTAILLEQCPNRIFVPNAAATQESNAVRYSAIGLSDAQIEMLASMAPKGEYMLMTPSFTRVAEIALTGETLKICGSSKPQPHISNARRLIAEGIAPGDPFLERWLEQ